MLRRFYPKQYMDSTYEIDFEGFYQKGYRGVIFDIDNTLVRHNEPADERALGLFQHLHELGYETLVLSNNKRPRVEAFAKQVQAQFIFKGGKPGKAGYRRAMEMMHTNAENTLFVGDQLFTDVWGANRCGIYALLVKPIHPKEEIQIVLKRYLEKIVLYFYKKDMKQRGRKNGN